MQKPKVSIIMSVYNGEEYLEGAIESILNQSMKDFEFILINDGSEDSSGKIMKKYAVQDSRIIFIDQKNSGLAEALNKGIKIASGKYIARQDADDMSLPERLKKQVNLLDSRNDVGICATNVWFAGRDGTPVYSFECPDMASFNKNLKLRLLEGRYFITHGSVMIRKTVLQNLNQIYRFRYGQDYDLWLRLAGKTTFYIIEDPLYIYRRIDKNTNASASIRRAELVKLMLKLLEEREKNNGIENMDWQIEMKKILNAPELMKKDQSKPNCTEAYMQLLKGQQISALKDLLSKSFRLQYLPILCLCAMPFGWRLSRILHRFINRNNYKLIWHHS